MSKLVAILVILSLFTTSSSAQMETSRGNSKAEVQTSSGRITFFDLRSDSRLTYKDKSFLGIRVGSQFFTNHDELPDEVSALSTSNTSRNKDTLISVWAHSQFELRQTVSPVFEGDAAKILVRFYLRNTSTQPVPVSCSYLLDLAVRSDDGQVLAQGIPYRSWSRINGEDVHHTAVFENELPNAPSYNLGLCAEGIWRSLTVPLERPRQLTIGDWRLLQESFPAFVTDPLPLTRIEDGAILAEWEQKMIQPGSTIEIGSFIYGPGYYEQCMGNFMSIIFPMSDLTVPADWQGDTVATLAVYLMNIGKQGLATNTDLTLTLNNGLGVFTSNGLEAEQTVEFGSIAAEEHVGHIFALGKLVSSDSLTFTVGLDVSSSLLPPSLEDCDLQYTHRQSVASVAKDGPIAGSVVLFPNPSSESIFINGLKSGKYDLHIFDLAGREIFMGSLEGPQDKINLSDFATGSYRILLRNGSENYSLPLVISRAQNK